MLASSEDAGHLAKAAAAEGASALGMAGGDGSLGRVAAVALEHDLPFVPVPFGTRNHFARNLGLALDDPAGALAAFAGEERRVDLGLVAGLAFLNNVSLGLYASLVHDPGHRTKNRVVALARMGPAALGRSRRPLAVSFEVHGEAEEHEALLLLVANNEYDLGGDGFGSRGRFDEGRLVAYVLEAVSRARLVALLARAAAGRLEGAEGWTEYSAPRFRVDTPRRRIHAAVDGEPVVLRPPLDFEIRPRALRVLIPRVRNGADVADASR